LIEAVTALAVLALGAALGAPPLLRATAALRVDLAAREVAGVLAGARILAIRRSANVAVKFAVEPGGAVSFAVYRDGDGDGVLARDVESGADPEVAAPRRLEHVGREVRFGLPAAPVRDPGDRSAWLPAGGDPVRFNRSDMASFSSLGESTPGSLYLTDGDSHLVVVRLFGRTGKIQLLTYDFAAQIWKGR
jgi:hypothetical protein